MGCSYWCERQGVEVEPEFAELLSSTTNRELTRSVFSSCVVFGIGLQAGINYQISKCCFLFATAEVVVNGSFSKCAEHSVTTVVASEEDGEFVLLGPDVAEISALGQSLAITTVIPVRRGGMVVTFPITIGIRNTF